MCLENRAANSAYYLNAQLRGLWDNAVRCSEAHGIMARPTKSEVEFGTCLYEFFGPGSPSHLNTSTLKPNLAFYAKFDMPVIDFVCNHEVILYLNIKEGHYSTDIEKYSTKGENIHKMDKTKLAFRMDFSNHTIKDVRCKQIGNRDYILNLFILDTNSASFCDELSEIPGIRVIHDEKTFREKELKIRSMVHYMTKFYLPLLKRAGHHVLHSLPDFDILSSTSAIIDYSLISKIKLANNILFDIKIEDVNTYLKGLWLQAAAYIDEFGTDHNHNDGGINHYLAEHKSFWPDGGEDCHFHMRFGPMQIQAQCKREVILYFNLQDVYFYLGSGFGPTHHSHFTDWKVAIIVDIVYKETENGCVRRLELNMNTARFCEYASALPSPLQDHLEMPVRLKSTLVRYLTTYYIDLLKRAGHDCIYHHDKRIIPVDPMFEDDEDHMCGCLCEAGDCGHEESVIRWGEVPKRRLMHTHRQEFDQIIAVTQGSLNAHLQTVWSKSLARLNGLGPRVQTWSSKIVELETCLAEYSLVHEDFKGEVFFNANFGAPKIQLVCKEGSRSIIIYFTLKAGHLKVLGENKTFVKDGAKYHFSGWRLAFTVDLKLVSCEETDVSASILQAIGIHDRKLFKQLIIDFESAKFCHELSSVPGLLDGTDYRLIRAKRQALMRYVKKDYFKILAKAGHHILYSLPVAPKDGQAAHSHSLTSVKFQLYPFHFGQDRVFEGVWGEYQKIYERNMILFLGMGSNRKMPSGGLAPKQSWGCGLSPELTYGTVCIPREYFLGSYILNALTDLNQKTTILPELFGIDAGEWVLKLSPWNEHPIKKRSKSQPKWTRVDQSKNDLKYKWFNSDEWHYYHEGNSGNNGKYEVKCDTKNYLSIVPGNKAGGCLISVNGTVTIELRYNGESGHWRSDMSASWSAELEIMTDVSHGVRVQQRSSSISPTFSPLTSTQELGRAVRQEAHRQLKLKLPPQVIDLQHVAQSLKTCLDNICGQLKISASELVVCNPVFNYEGDLLLEYKAKRSSTTKSQAFSQSVLPSGQDIKSSTSQYQTNGPAKDAPTKIVAGTVLTPITPPKIVPLELSASAPTKVATATPIGNGTPAPVADTSKAISNGDAAKVVPVESKSAAPADASKVIPGGHGAAARTDSPKVVPTEPQSAAPADASKVIPSGPGAAAPTDSPKITHTESKTAAPVDASKAISNGHAAPVDAQTKLTSGDLKAAVPQEASKGT